MIDDFTKFDPTAVAVMAINAANMNGGTFWELALTVRELAVVH